MLELGKKLNYLLNYFRPLKLKCKLQSDGTSFLAEVKSLPKPFSTSVSMYLTTSWHTAAFIKAYWKVLK